MSETPDAADEASTYDLSGRRRRDTEGVGTDDEAATTSEPVTLINARLADLAEANTLYGKDDRLGAPHKIARNDREISWLKNLRSTILTAAQSERQPPKVCIKKMRKSDDSADYFVSISVGDREVTPHVFGEEYKAAYHVALYSWLLNGTDKPDLMAFGPSISSTDRATPPEGK